MSEIIIDGIKVEIQKKERNLLADIVNSGCKVSFSCLSGICESCKAFVVSGDEHLVTVNKRIFNEENDDSVLLCCVQVKDNNAKVEIKTKK